jgi:hypothetical protein
MRFEKTTWHEELRMWEPNLIRLISWDGHNQFFINQDVIIKFIVKFLVLI